MYDITDFMDRVARTPRGGLSTFDKIIEFWEGYVDPYTWQQVNYRVWDTTKVYAFDACTFYLDCVGRFKHDITYRPTPPDPIYIAIARGNHERRYTERLRRTCTFGFQYPVELIAEMYNPTDTASWGSITMFIYSTAKET